MLARCCGCSPLKSCRFSWSGLARAICEMGHNLYDYDVRCGSWLCENAKTLNRDRRSYSSKTALGLQFESAFNLEIELKNVILAAFRLFAFLHSQGQTRTSRHSCRTSVLRILWYALIAGSEVDQQGRAIEAGERRLRL